jgi:hypothetical protein
VGLAGAATVTCLFGRVAVGMGEGEEGTAVATAVTGAISTTAAGFV